MASSRQRPSRSAGFTVVEVLVALAIVALAFGVAFRDLSGALDQLGGSYRSTQALSVAESLLDRVGFDIPLQGGGDSGVTREGYDWAVETQPYVPPTGPVAAPLMGYLVTVTIGWKERGNSRQVRLNTLRLAYRAEGA